MLILASNSLRRLELLKQVGIKVDKILSPDIDETQLKLELPAQYVKRMALSKSDVVHHKDSDYVLSADTVVTRGRRILMKPENRAIAEKYLNFLSGCRHRVMTSVCLSHKGQKKIKTVVTVVRMKNLSKAEISSYLDSNEWLGKAGGYAIQGRAAMYIPFISGSYTNVVGLPLTETVNLLVGNGFRLNDHMLTN